MRIPDDILIAVESWDVEEFFKPEVERKAKQLEKDIKKSIRLYPWDLMWHEKRDFLNPPPWLEGVAVQATSPVLMVPASQPEMYV